MVKLKKLNGRLSNEMLYENSKIKDFDTKLILKNLMKVVVPIKNGSVWFSTIRTIPKR